MNSLFWDKTPIPARISNKLAGLQWKRDDIGMSNSVIVMFDKMALKIEKVGQSSKNEVKLLAWLDGKLPVPKIMEAETLDGYSFLLMTKLQGEMACSENSLRNIHETVRALAKGLEMLWQINITNCPCSNVVREKLIQAKYNMENKLVDINDFNPETFGEEGFSDIPDLYNYLDAHRPKENFVFSHGDYCLPNVFVSGSCVTGFLDWGNGGIADKWQDIALCVRSLKHNCVKYAGYSETEYLKHKKQLFRELGIAPDEEKIRYYILLDELF